MNTNMRRNKRRVFPKSNSKSIQRSKPSNKQFTYRFKKHVDLGTISSGLATNNYGSFLFKLQDIPNYSEMQAVFDSFRINAVRLTFIPASNITTGSNADFSNRIVTAIDYNSSTVPTSVNQLRDYESCKVSPNNVLHTVYFKPKLNPLGTTGNLAGPQPWVATTNATAQYFAVLYAMEHPAYASSSDLYRVEAKYYLEFKDPK